VVATFSRYSLVASVIPPRSSSTTHFKIEDLSRGRRASYVAQGLLLHKTGPRASRDLKEPFLEWHAVSMNQPTFLGQVPLTCQMKSRGHSRGSQAGPLFIQHPCRNAGWPPTLHSNPARTAKLVKEEKEQAAGRSQFQLISQ